MQAAAAGAERSYPTTEVRGSGLECQAATAQGRPRGATLRPRSGVAAGRRHPESEVRGDGREELPCFGGQGQQPKGATPHLRPGAVPERSHPTSEARAATKSSNLTPKAKDSSREGQPHVQGVVAVWAQEGLEEPSHVEGQEWRR